MTKGKIYLVDVEGLGEEEGYPELEGEDTACFRVSINSEGKLYGGFKVGSSYFRGRISEERIIKESGISWKSY